MEVANKTDEDEVAAVLQVLDDETRAFFNKDFEAFSKCWVNEPYIRRLGWWTRGGVVDRWGWEAIGARAKANMEEFPEPNRSAVEFFRKNMVVRVSGDMAWATFDEYAPDTGEPSFDMPGVTRGVRVLEKHQGQWRIAFVGFVHQAVETAHTPLFRVDGRSHVTWMNEPARKLLGDSDILAVTNGRLHAADRLDNRKLQSAIADASLRDQTLDGDRAAIPVTFEATHSEEVCVCWVLTEGSGGGAVLVSVNNPTFAHDQIEAGALAFGLSPSQRRLAEFIISGLDLTQAAERMGVSVNTTRTQLQRMFDKTGARSQPALVRALLSVVPPRLSTAQS